MLYQAQLLRTTGGETLNPSLSHVVDALRDLLRFISLHPETPRNLPIHIYLSALPFAPNESKIRHLYANSALNTTQSVTVVSGLEQHWNPISVTFEESSSIKDMDLSPCGTMVASRSEWGHVRLYNAKSGQLLQSLGSKAEVYGAYSIAFSPGSQCLAATSVGGVQVWDVVSGELHRLCDLSGHHGRITTTAFAPPSQSRQQQLCSASEDRTVRLWD
ncbi:WD40-repeat-containing domain protein, partial [Coprinopsis sp. MPI-PUGE-AT-0042]